jgi:ribosomal protein S18 acetylase RimI-like enzyme
VYRASVNEFSILLSRTQIDDRIGLGGWTCAEIERTVLSNPKHASIWVSVTPSAPSEISILGLLQGFMLVLELPDAIEVLWLWTAPEARRQGVGRKLIEALMEYHRAKEIWLETSAINLTAVGFYEALGFQIVGRRPGYFARSDALVLTKTLP